MRSLQSILDLVTSASKLATKIVVERVEKHPVHGLEWMMYPPFHPWTDASTLTIERKGDSRRASRDGVAVLHQHEQVQTIGLASYFIDAKVWVTELAGLDLANIAESKIAGRDVLVLPLSDLTLSIDAKYGVILAAEDHNESVRAVSVEFLDKWVDEEQPPVEEAPTYQEISEELPPPALPPAPSGNRDLRVLCTWGDISDWKPGDQVSLFLYFNLNDPPFEQLKTTRRGFTEPGEIYKNQRSYKFHADGWNATISTKVPLRAEENLTGYFTHSSYASTRRTSAVITAVYSYDKGAIIDVTLNGAKPPRYQEPLEWSSTSTCDGEIFWLSDKSLPFVRGFDVSTGKLLHEISIPTFNEITLENGNTVRAAKRLWELPDLKEATDPVPAIPAGWTLHKSFGKNFHVVSAENGTWKQTILKIKPFKALELDLGFDEISAIYQYGELIYLRALLHTITFTKDLEILSVEVHGNPNAGYWPLSDLPPGDSPTLGFPTGSLMMFHEQEGTYAFHDPETTEQLTTVNLDRNSFSVAYSSHTKIVISLKNPESRLIDKLLVWEPKTGWREQSLER
ncbi:hypothetical protein N24_2767 [Corynebacterium suranareeae]|uniref:Uncharacterized protein n=1 Tax=Corynebacterium suranareeae TaxID=2506452 RepID=A0A160PS97_9CORY|nr:hypothetical protein [Corynebacterium suranareeae]BAU97029.1 hypothetical protein N24_2767 [Corynebacterium suranareeae]